VKTVAVLLVAAALSAPWLGYAAEEPDPRVLGTAEAMVLYCAKADAGAAEKYRAQVKRMVERASPEAVAHARASGEYRKAQAAVENFVDKVDPHNMKKLCSETVAVGQ
jgi:hypothetical protein